MARHLILVRHAKSSWDDPTGDDRDRPLNERGRRDGPRIGVWLSQNAPAPDRILCSDAARTRETWDLIAPAVGGIEPEYRADLYLAAASRMRAMIATDESGTLVVVAHNPGIGELAASLGSSDHPRFADFPTGAVALFDLTGPRPTLAAFVTPHDLS